MIKVDGLSDQYHKLPASPDPQAFLKLNTTHDIAGFDHQRSRASCQPSESNSPGALTKCGKILRLTESKSELQILQWRIQGKKEPRKRRENSSLRISNKPEAFKLNFHLNLLNFCTGKLRRASAPAIFHQTSKSLIGLVVFVTVLLSTLALLSLNANAYGLNANSSALPATDSQPIANPSTRSTAAPELLIRSRRNQPSDAAPESEDVLVQTKFGLFKGIDLSSHKQRAISDRNNVKVFGFLGIRYASAPVKRLRFMPPTAYHYAPNQVHNMQQFGPICRQRWPFGWFSNSQRHPTMNASDLEIQLRLMKEMVPKELFVQLRPLLKQLAHHEQSEDCLNLNIYQPLEARAAVRQENSDGTQTSSLLPVLVIIHGESFDYGAGSTINGLKVAEQGRVIVITFNFRLNILGFPPKLSGASRGNLGLMDQVAALHWIKDNIGSFGGSPNNITLMGTRKGAIFVNLLMLSPLAKGLFHAAIMEDGSALTPFVANHIAGQQSVAAVQHVRLLAKLCDCPLHQLHLGVKSGGANATSAGVTIVGQQQQQQQPLGVDQHQQQRQLDETKMNALTFECLRHKPIEQLLLPIPLELLHLSAGQLAMEQRWLRNLTAAGLGQMAQAEATIGESPSHYDHAAGQMMVPVDANLLARLVEQANREQLVLLSGGRDLAATSELFSAIYLQQNQVRPLFGPALDGTIVPGEDPAAAMLKPNSLFTQRHLLIGLTQPMLSPALSPARSHENVNVEQEEEKISSLEETNQAQFELRPEHMMAELITIHTQQSGLSNEQAVDMVNKFVRSFYRYHNQEITNSIISNYLSRSSHKLMRTPKHQQHQETHKSNNPINQHSLLLLDSLLEAFQDALTNVPVLKTSLIHASRQLDLVAEVFAARQFERFRLASSTTKRPIKSNDTQELLESFVLFAQSLFSDSNWPLELKSSGGQASQQLPQAKSTYLYQFDAEMLVNDVKRTIQRLLAKQSSNSIWKSIREILYGLLIRLQSEEFRHKLGFGYIIRPVESTTDDDGYIYPLFTEWLTTRLASTLLQFIKTGKVNQKLGEENQTADELEVLNEKVVHVESKCLAEAQDHHLVQAVTSSERSHFTSENCRRDLNALAFDLVTYEMTNLNLERSTKWPVFNLFSQQVATLPPISTSTGNQWLLRPISGDDNQYDQKSSFFARSSFWSNFVPALNCSKTQPINPRSLLTNPPTVGALNSSLLHLNLVFSCSLGGKTSYSTIESIAIAVRQSLETKLEQLTQVNEQSDQQQNHHNLRMANTSGGLEVDSQQQLANNNQEASQMTPTNDAGSSTFDMVGTNSAIDLPTKAVELRTKYAGLVLVVCGVLIATTLVSGACAIARQRKRAKKSVQETSQNPQQQPDQNVDHSMESSSSTRSNQHPVAELAPTANHSPRLLLPALNHNQYVGPVDEQYLFHKNGGELEDKQQEQDAETSFQHLSQQPLVYWDHQPTNSRQRSMGGSQQELVEPTIGVNLCKSHSLLKISNNGLLITTPAENYIKSELNSLDNSNNNDAGYLKQQEPIMVPLQDYSVRHANENIYPNTIARVPSNCVTNGVGYADSSSETQGQTSSVGSVSKKRVKISEPIGMVKRNQQQNRTKQSRIGMFKSITGHNQDSLYCPMHSDQVGSPADTTPTATYFIEDTFLQPGNIEWWSGNGLNEMNMNLVDQQQLNHNHNHHHQQQQHHHHHHQHHHNHQSTCPTSSSTLTRGNYDGIVDYSMANQNHMIEPAFHHPNNTISTGNRSASNKSSRASNAIDYSN